MMRAVVTGALVATAAAQGQCFEKYQCIFHHDVNGQEYSWDLHQLCQQSGAGYVYNAPFNTTYNFNICGNTSTVCSPGWTMYNSHGAAVQTWTSPPACPTPTCTDWDTGAPICCTGECAVLGTQYFQFSLLDPNNPLTGGIQFVHTGMPPDINDPFNCPVNPVNNLARERQLIIQIACDQGGSKNPPTLSGIIAAEVGTCLYTISAKSYAACGIKGDPYDGYYDDPGHSFGFVVLGATLTVLTYFAVTFADGRGWLDPVKNRLPAWAKCQTCSRGGSSSGGSSSYSSSYKTVGSATPISASAYGTA